MSIRYRHTGHGPGVVHRREGAAQEQKQQVPPSKADAGGLASIMRAPPKRQLPPANLPHIGKNNGNSGKCASASKSSKKNSFVVLVAVIVIATLQDQAVVLLKARATT